MSEAVEDRENHSWTYTNKYTESKGNGDFSLTKKTILYNDPGQSATSDRLVNQLLLGNSVSVGYDMKAGAAYYQSGSTATVPLRMEVKDDFWLLDDTALSTDDVSLDYLLLQTPKVYHYSPIADDDSFFEREQTGYGDAVVYALLENGWVEVADLDASDDGSFVLTTVSGTGASVDPGSGAKLILPQEAKQVKVVCETQEDAVDMDFQVYLAVHPTQTVLDMIEAKAARSDYLKLTLFNQAAMDCYYGDELIWGIEDRDSAYLHGRNYRVASYLKKAFEAQPIPEGEQRLPIVTTLTANEQSNVLAFADYRDAINDGIIPFVSSGVFYDLLPKGVVPELRTVRVASGGSLIDAYSLDNYKGSGRTLVVIKARFDDQSRYVNASELSTINSADHIPSNATTFPKDGIRNYQTVSFTSYLPLEEIDNPGDTSRLLEILSQLRNVSAFETDGDWIGNLEGWQGERDDEPDSGRHSQTVSALGADLPLMTDLDPADGGTPSFLYMSANLTGLGNIDLARVNSVEKRVSVSGSGYWTRGDKESGLPATVCEGGTYTYRLSAFNTLQGDASVGGLVMVDKIESYTLTAEERQHEGDGTTVWQGSFRGIDVSQMREQGANPEVYYSTDRNLNLDAFTVDDLQNAARWSKTAPNDLSMVTGIAIDLRYQENGVDEFRLVPGKSLIAYLYMQAPAGAAAAPHFNSVDPNDADSNDHAYNNYYLLSDAGSGTQIAPFTRVGIVPFDLRVEKEWFDDENRDGIRPDTVKVWLYADGVKTDLSIDLKESENWEGGFDHLPQYDENGNYIEYTVAEEVPDGYSCVVSRDGSVFTLTNTHVPERISVTVHKTWEDDERPNGSFARPSSITVTLYADEEYVIRRSFRSDVNGDWSTTFENLFKYKDGQAITYTVVESAIPDFITTYGSESEYSLLINNRYYPFGDLSVTKQTRDVTAAAAEKDTEFPITLILKNAQGEQLTGLYEYTVTKDGETVDSGWTRSGRTIRLKEGQKLLVKKIPARTEYQIAEQPVSGWVQVGATNTSGVIVSNTEKEAVIVNRYVTSGAVQLSAKKQLDGRDLAKNQFLFRVKDETNRIIASAYNAADGTVSFGTINYSADDDGKTFLYTISEVVQERSGYTYDSKIYSVKVTPRDNGKGTLVCEIEYKAPDGSVISEPPTFENVYRADGTTVLRAWKNLAGRALEDGEFDFELLDANGNVIQTKSCGEDAKIEFDPIGFCEADVGNTYYYFVRESAGSDSTVIYSDEMYGYSVLVNDNDNGTLSFTQSFVDTTDRFVTCSACGGAGVDGSLECGTCHGQGKIWNDAWTPAAATAIPVFHNELVDGSLSVSKSVTGTGAPEDTEFTFRVTLIGDKVAELGEAEGEGRVITYVKTADGTNESVTVPYKDGSFTVVLKGGEKALLDPVPAGTIYQITEQTADGWILISQQDASGTVPADDEAAAIFTNRFQPDIASAVIYGTKLMDNQPAEADAFEFVMHRYDTDGTTPLSMLYLDENEEQKSASELKVKTLDGGLFQFPVLVYDQKGTYNYTIEELADPTQQTITFDSHKELVTVKVTRNEGVLQSEVTYDDEDGVAFKNLSRPGNLEVTKSAEGLTEGNKDSDFTFRIDLTNPNGIPVDEGSEIRWYVRNADGSIAERRGTEPSAGGGESGDGRRSARTAEVVGPAAPSVPDEAPQEPENANTEEARNDGGLLGWLSDVFGGLLSILSTDVYAEGDEGEEESEAYAVLSGNDLIFLRSSSYTAGAATITDVAGTEYTGTIYSGFETASYSTYSDVPWYGNRTSIKRVVFADPENQKICPSSTAYWFYGCTALTGGQSFNATGFDMSGNTDMKYMFYGCTAMTTLNLNGWNTSAVKNTQYMFYNCSKMTSLLLSAWDVSAVEDMSYMFYNCSKLTALNLRGWNTQNVTNMKYMFYGCAEIKFMDLRSFKTSKVTDMSYMFYNCQTMNNVLLDGWDTSSVKNMAYMFYGCKAMANPNISGWDVSRVENMAYMFYNCVALTSLDLSGWNTQNVKSMDYMFCSCSGLTVLDLSAWNTESLTTISYMFYKCTSLTDLGVSAWDTGKVTEMTLAFGDCTALTVLDVSDWDTSAATNMASMFYNCQNLRELDVSGWNTSAVTKISWMFCYCQNLQELDVSDWNTSRVTSMSNMFNNCKNLRELDVSGWNTSAVTNMEYMFANCQNLQELDVSDWNTSRVTTMSAMFNACRGLKTLDLSTWNVYNATSMSDMFNGCSGLTSLDLSSWKTNSRAWCDRMFANCSNLSSIKLGPNYRFREAVPPAPPSNEVYTGLWIRLEGCDTPLSAGELRTAYNGSANMVGTWVWQLNYQPGEDTAYAVLDEAGNLTFFHSDEDRENGTTGTIADRLGNEYTGTIFTGFEQMASVPWSGSAASIKTVKVASGQTISPLFCNNWFSSCTNLHTAELSGLNTSQTVNMNGMFRGCGSLTRLDLSGWDLSGVKDTSYMFAGCGALKFLTVDVWNTEGIQHAGYMFRDCASLETLDLSGWDLSGLSSEADMEGMLSGCTALSQIRLGENFRFVGEGSRLPTPPSGMWRKQASDPILVKTPLEICALQGADLAGTWIWEPFSPGANGAAYAVFDSSSGELVFFRSRQLYRSDTEYDSVTDIAGNTYSGRVFAGFESESAFTETTIPWYAVRNEITSVSVAPGQTVSPLRTAFWFSTDSTANVLTSCDLSGLDVSAVSDMSEMFRGRNKLASLDLSGWNTAAATDMSAMFSGCRALTSLDLSGFDTSGAELRDMFRDCAFTEVILGAGFSFLGTGTPAILPSNEGVDYSGKWIREEDESAVPYTPEELQTAYEPALAGKWICENASKAYAVLSGGELIFLRSNSYVSGNTITDIGGTTYTGTVYSGVETATYGDSGAPWYASRSSITSIRCADPVNQRIHRENMAYYFYYLSNVTTADVSGFDTSKVKSMKYAFYGCSKLTSLDLSSWSTDSLTSMYYMFYGCSSLTSLDLSGWDTRNAYYLTGKFSDSLRRITLSENFRPKGNGAPNDYWNNYSSHYMRLPDPPAATTTGKWIKTTGGTAYYPSEIQGLTGEDIAGTWIWEVNPDVYCACAVLDSEGCLTFFRGVEGDISNGAESSVRAVDGQVYSGKAFKINEAATSYSSTSVPWNADRSSIVKVRVADGYTISTKTMDYWFRGSANLTEVDLTGFDTTGMTSTANLFNGCSSLTTLDLGGLNTGAVTDMQYMFNNCSSLTALDLSDLNTEAVTNMSYMFNNCSSLTALDLGGLNTGAVTNMSYMFYNCSSLKTLDLSSFNTENVTGMGDMFAGCKSLTSLDLSGFRTPNLTALSCMFMNCWSLVTLDVSNFDTSKVKQFYEVFYDCRSLKVLDLKNWNTSGVVSQTARYALETIFYGCSSLEELDMSGFVTPSGVYTYSNFGGCYKLSKITFGGKFYWNGSLSWQESSVLPTPPSSITTGKWIKIIGGSPYGPYTSEELRNRSAAQLKGTWVWEKKASLQPYACAVLDSEGNMTFFLSDQQPGDNGVYYDVEGNEYRGTFFTGFDNVDTGSYDSRVRWNNWKSQIKTVKVAEGQTVKTNYMAHWFYNCSALESADLTGFDTSSVTSLYDLFSGCSSLASVNAAGLDTANVTNMERVFNGCSSLTSLDLSGWGSAAPTRMMYMFNDCSSLESLDLSGWDTSGVTYMTSLFNNCSSLESLDLSGWDTAAATDMSKMFNGCKALASVTLSSGFGFGTGLAAANQTVLPMPPSGLWRKDGSDLKKTPLELKDLSQTADLAGTWVWDEVEPYLEGVAYAVLNSRGELILFRSRNTYLNGAEYDSVVDVKGNTYSGKVFTGFETEIMFSTSNVPWYADKALIKSVRVAAEQVIRPVCTAYWFSDHTAMTEADLSRLDVSAATDMQRMFSGCSGLKTINLTGWNTSAAANMSYLFNGCSGLKALDVSGWDTSKVTDMRYMFSGCSGLTALDVTGWDTSKVTDMSYMFNGCKALTALDVSGFDTSAVTGMSYMFAGCSALTALDVTAWNTSSVTNMSYMFNNCSALTALNVTGISTSSVTNMDYMFNGCKALTALDVSGFDTSAVTGMSCMFAGCSALTALDLSAWNTQSLTNASYAFQGCSKLVTLDLAGWSLKAGTDASVEYMFNNCSSLISVNISGLNTSRAIVRYMFNGCPKLQFVTLGENFNFKGRYTTSSYYWTILPVPSGDDYTGMWEHIADDGVTSYEFSAADLRDQYVGEVHAGLWYWQVKDGGKSYAVLDSNGALTFFNSDRCCDPLSTGPFTATDGSVYYGKLYTGFDKESSFTAATVPWAADKARIRSVVVRDSIKPLSCQYWFADCPNLTSVELLGLNMTEMGSSAASSMFSNCSSLASVTLGEGFRFCGAILPTPPAEYTHGTWRNSTVSTSAEFSPAGVRALDASVLPGTWVWVYSIVRYAPNGGTTYAASVPLADQPLTMPDASTTFRPGYKLLGWSKLSSGTGTVYQPGEVVEISSNKSDLTLYAIWERDTSNDHQYVVNRYVQDENDLTAYKLAGMDVIRKPIGDHVEVRPEVPEGLKFNREKSFVTPMRRSDPVMDPDGMVEFDVTEDVVVSISYFFDRTIFYVEFDGNEADYGSVEKKTMFGAVRDTIPLNGFTRIGYIFTGWNTEANGSGTPYSAGQSVINMAADRETVKLYAQWKKNDNVGGATNGSFTVSVKAGQTLVLQDLPAGTSYTITEIDIPDGWTQSGITNPNGTIRSTVTDSSTVTNTYSAEGEATIIAHKRLEGDTLVGGRFKFELLDADGRVIDMAKNSEIDANSSDNSAPIVFTALHYTEEGIYSYSIKEVSGSEENVIYDQHTESVTVTVTDRGDGTLRTVVNYDADGAVFTNRMKPCGLSVKKEIVNATEEAEDTQFSFTVTLLDASGNELTDAYALSGVAGKTSYSSGESVSIRGGQSFQISGLPSGTSYTVTEAASDGWVLTHKENESGSILAGESVEATFENTYSTSGSVELEAAKSFLGGEIGMEMFAFTLEDDSGKVLATAYAVADTGDASHGTVTFEPLFYDKEDNGESYTYVIRETAGEEENVLYDSTEHRVRVTLNDDGKGTLVPTVEYLTDGDTAGIVFENAVLHTLTVSKTIGGTMGDLTERFTYTIELYYPSSSGTGEEPYTEEPTVSGGIGWAPVADNPGMYTFMLGHGDSLTLYGLPYGLSYRVTETNSGLYEATVSINGGLAGETAEASGIIRGDVTVAYVNELNGSVPTAAKDSSLLLYLAGLGALATGAFLTLRIRRKEEY